MLLLGIFIICNFFHVSSVGNDHIDIEKYKTALVYLESTGLVDSFYFHPDDKDYKLFLCVSDEILKYVDDSATILNSDCENLGLAFPKWTEKTDLVKELNKDRDSCNAMLFFTKVFGNKFIGEIWWIPRSPIYIVQGDRIIGHEYPKEYKDLSFMGNYVRILFEFEDEEVKNVCYIKGTAN
ncbi:MAG: hypothetical protein KDC73_03525 [Ignavibacteriae bacterium]|nr:hypothetical protein [Ignavibacteriota bacterium]MCB9244208.1 hypothetical protein [Ignavibacteriales bacterium]